MPSYPISAAARDGFRTTRADLIEARALYVSCGFAEISPATETPGPFQDHWYEKLLDP